MGRRRGAREGACTDDYAGFLCRRAPQRLYTRVEGWLSAKEQEFFFADLPGSHDKFKLTKDVQWPF
jgi:hypothetical protein